MRLVFEGPAGIGKRRAAEALARTAGGLLLTLDVGAALASEMPFPRLLQLALRDARLHDAVLYVGGAERLHGDGHAADEAALANALAEHALRGTPRAAFTYTVTVGVEALEPVPAGPLVTDRRFRYRVDGEPAE